MKKNNLLRNEDESQRFLATLQEISKVNFTVSDDTILDKLYSHIENSFNTTDYYITDIAGWLETIFNGWNESEYFYGVKVLAVRLIGLLGSSLDGFQTLEAKNILLHVKNLASSDEVLQDSCLMVPLINVFIMFLKHEMGWKWITETTVWKCAVKAYYEDRSMYTKRAGVQFLSLLLTKSDEYDSHHGIAILSVIFEPLLANHLIIITQCSDSDDDYIRIGDGGEVVEITSNLTSAAKFASDVIGEILSKPNANMPTLVMVFRSFYGDSPILQHDVLDSCSSPQDEQVFSLLLLMINLSNASRKHKCIKEHLLQESVCSLRSVYTKSYTTVGSMIKLKHFYAVINYCVTCLSWCNKLKKMNNMCKSSCTHCEDFEKTMTDTLKVLLHDHSGVCSSPKLFMARKIGQTEKFLNVDNLVACTLHCTFLTELPSDVNQRRRLNVEFMQLAVLGLIRCLPFISYERIAFNIFLDVLSLIDSLVEYLNVLRHTTLPVLLHLLTLAVKLIEEYKLPYWKVHEANIKLLFLIIMRVIFIENIDIRVTITSIQFLKHLLIFLVMPDCDKVPRQICFDVRIQPIKLLSLSSKLDSMYWEVRDSTLELFQTLIDLFESNPGTVKHYFDSEIVKKIYKVGANDESSYVRASALDFFSKAMRVKQFSSFITPSELCDHALKAVKDDTTPVVRKVACELVTALYVTYEPNLLSDADAVYDTMLSVINKDLDLEVKKAALIFWECSIKKHFIDQAIPLHPSTLSSSSNSEKKDKVSLDIVEVLKTLGQIGCLKAIWLGLNDDCDLTVSQEAFRIVNYLDDLNKDWNYIGHFLNPEEDNGCVEEEDKMAMSSKVLMPKDFFILVQKQDWNDKLCSRKDWLENACDDLASLMDHILNTGYIVDDHNAVDCY